MQVKFLYIERLIYRNIWRCIHLCVCTIINIDNSKIFNTNFTCFFCRRVLLEVLTWIHKTVCFCFVSFCSRKVSLYAWGKDL